MNQTESATPVQEEDLSLANFAVFSIEELATLAKKLRLKMGRFGLRVCQDYYRTQKRIPRVNELFLLDSIVQEAYERPSTLLLSEMTTESDVIADTFADLMTRRSATQRADKKPLSLAALASLMESWLTAHSQGDGITPEIGVRFSAYRDLLLAADGYQRTASSGTEETDVSIGVRARQTATDTQTLADGDYVYGILTQKENDGAFFRALASFLSSTPLSTNVKAIKIVQNQALLPILLDMDHGMTVCPEKVPHIEKDGVSVLALPFTGTVFVASPEQSADLLLEAQENGLPIFLLAKITSKRTVDIVADEITLRYPLEFLQSMVFSRLCNATVEAPSLGEIDVSLSRIGTCTLNGKRNAVVKVDATGTSPFRAGLLGVLYSLSHCIAAGADVANIKLASRLSLCPDDVGENLSAILGLYRAQAEFALCGNPPFVTIGKGSHPSLSAVTLAPLPDHTVSATAVGNGTNIFYLEPLYTSDGIPDFDDLKKMYDYIGVLLADGKVLSIRPTGENLLADLEEMSKDAVVEYVPDTPVSSHIGGFLIETASEIQGVLIAKTEAPQTQAFENSDKSEADS